MVSFFTYKRNVLGHHNSYTYLRPDKMASNLQSFLNRELPEKLKGNPEEVLAPAKVLK